MRELAGLTAIAALAMAGVLAACAERGGGALFLGLAVAACAAAASLLVDLE